MGEVMLEARAVSKRFASRRMMGRQSAPVAAVDRVSCALRRGEVLGLVGESGSGKTTLAKILIGLTAPSEGEAFISGRSWRELRGASLRALRRTAQFIFQDPMSSLNPLMSIEEILSEPLIIHQPIRRDERRGRVRDLLKTVQLPEAVRRRLPRELSGGERQRVVIARALATEPEALICDEPIASLDVLVGRQILELLRGLHRASGVALLFVSHDLRAVASLCGRIAVMRQGRLVEEGPTAQLLQAPAQAYTRLLIRSASLDLDAA